jgi:invasion protein IalB
MDQMSRARRPGRHGWALAVLVAGLLAASPAMAQTEGQGANGARVGDTFGDWLFECTAIAEGQTACSLTQTIVVQETGRPIAKFSLARGNAQGTGFLVVMLPLGLDIPAGVQGAIDTAAGFPMVVETCIAGGCLATAQIEPERLKAMKSGTKFNLAFRIRGEQQPVTIAGSLKGITAGVVAARIE